jgi:hypothetical protein
VCCVGKGEEEEKSIFSLSMRRHRRKWVRSRDFYMEMLIGGANHRFVRLIGRVHVRKTVEREN